MPFKGQINDAEIMAEREAEYNQLKLALHLAQADRQNYIEEMQTAMNKMKKTIEQLELERDGLMEQIAAVDSKANQTRDQRTCEDLANFAENKEWLQQQISFEKSKHIELDAKTRELEKHLWALINTAGSTKSAQEAMERLRRKQTCLEGRLVHSLKTYNDALGKNMSLRAEIDTLRMERGRFDLIYRKLDLTLSKMRAEITRLTAVTTQAYDQREEAAQRIQALTEKTEKDNQQHNIEMKELVRLIDHDRKLKQFMKIKSAERQEDPQLTAWKTKRALEADEKRAEMEAAIKRYEQAFDHMLKLTNETNTDNILSSFLRQEDRNFALFNYVSEIHGQIEELVNENAVLSKQITDYRQWMTEAIQEKRSQIDNLESMNAATNEATEKVNAKLEKTKASLEETASIVNELVGKLNCNTTKLTRRLAAADTVTTETVLDYLQVVEDRVNEILLVRQYIAMNDPDAPFIAKAILIGGNLAPIGMAPPTIIPPNLHSDFDEGECLKERYREMITRKKHHRDNTRMFSFVPLSQIPRAARVRTFAAAEAEVRTPLSREELHKRVVNLVKSKEADLKRSNGKPPSISLAG